MGINQPGEPVGNPDLRESTRKSSRGFRLTISTIYEITVIFTMLFVMSNMNGVTGVNGMLAYADRDSSERGHGNRRILASERDIKDCEYCLDFNELKGIVQRSARAADSYIMTNVADATTIQIETKDEGQLATMEVFFKRIENIPFMKETVNNLLNLNRAFSDEYSQTLGYEKYIQEQREKYENKVKAMGDLETRTISVVEKMAFLNQKIEDMEDDLATKERSTNEKIKTLESEIQAIMARIADMKQQIREKLKNSGATNEDELSLLMNKISNSISMYQKEKDVCERKVSSNWKALEQLNLKHTEEHRILGDLELQLSQWNWMKHTLETINKFKGIKEKVEELQRSQLQNGKENINELIHKLGNRQKDYGMELRNLKANPAGTYKSSDSRVVEKDGKTTVITTTYESTRRSNRVATLEMYISTEGNTLRTWSREQFKTLNLSFSEIRNLTSTINNLEASIQGSSQEYQHFLGQMNLTRIRIEEIIKQINQFETELEDCEKLIGKNQDEINRLQRELDNLERYMNSIRDLDSRIAHEEANLRIKREELTKERQDFLNLRQMLLNSIAQVRRDLDNLKFELRNLVNKINEKMMESPRPDTFESEMKEYRIRVQRINQKYRDLLQLLESLKTTIC